MLASTDSTTWFIMLVIIFAAITLSLGFLAGVWVSSRRTRSRASTPAAPAGDSESVADVLMRERAVMASDRIRDLASGVATDVDAHSLRLSEITDELLALDASDSDEKGAGVVAALSQILAANETLHDRLARAEEQIAAQAEEIMIHESEARTDSLTGLANRRAFDDELKRRYSESRRKGSPLSLVLMDIDHFKEFNDTHGHQAGDEVLRAVGEALASTCREMDVPCRYGGEEFAVVMPSTHAQDGMAGAERIRHAVEAVRVNFEGKTLSVTTSMGVAELNDRDDVPSVVKRADEALYQSKAAGRNCGHWHDGDGCVSIADALTQEDPEPLPPTPRKARMSTLDNLPTRTKFAEELRHRIAESKRTGQNLAVMVMEVGSYNELNKLHGAGSGVVALDSVALVLQTTLRDTDMIARLTADTLCALLPSSSLAVANEVAERVINTIETCAPSMGEGLFDFAVSFGAAEIKPADTIETIVRRAELDMASRREKSVASS